LESGEVGLLVKNDEAEKWFVFEYEMSMVNGVQGDRFSSWGVVLNPKGNAENLHSDLDWENNPDVYYKGSEWWKGES
jgi:hypothetical protein